MCCPVQHESVFLVPNVCFARCALQIENAAEEPRVLCIVQDTTNSKTVNERLTLNLPASTTISKLFQDVARKAGYLSGTFDLAWGNTAAMVSDGPCHRSTFTKTMIGYIDHSWEDGPNVHGILLFYSEFNGRLM